MIEQLSKNEIRGIFMRNGFTVKEGCDDLKDYVYAAAYDLLKAQEERHRTIEARLSSIEKLLSAESKPTTAEHSCRSCHDTGKINILFQNTMASSENIPCPDCSYAQRNARIPAQEPEWRPMIEAPLDREIIVNHESVAYFAKWDFDVWECNPSDRGKVFFYIKTKDLSGWRPL